MYDLFLNESLVNVTLVCQDQHYKSHQVILSACSPVFKKIFTENVVSHPIVIFTDISREDMKLILDYIYNGEVKVKQDKVPVFLKAAEKLQLVGLNDCQIEHYLSPVNSISVTNRKETKSFTDNQDVQNLRESRMSPVLTDRLVEAIFIAETDIVSDGPYMHSVDENITSSNEKTHPQPRLATNISQPRCSCSFTRCVSIYTSDESEIVPRTPRTRIKMEFPKSPPDKDNKGDRGQDKSRLHVNPIDLKRTSLPKKTDNIRKKNGSSKNSKNSYDSNRQDNVDQSKEVYSNSERHVSDKSLSGTSKDQSPKNRSSNKDNKESSTSKQTSNSEKSTSEKTDVPFLKLHKYCVYHEKIYKDVSKHLKTHHSYGRNSYICKKCSQQFRFKRFCKESLKAHKCKN